MTLCLSCAYWLILAEISVCVNFVPYLAVISSHKNSPRDLCELLLPFPYCYEYMTMPGCIPPTWSSEPKRPSSWPWCSLAPVWMYSQVWNSGACEAPRIDVLFHVFASILLNHGMCILLHKVSAECLDMISMHSVYNSVKRFICSQLCNFPLGGQ